LFVGGAQQPAFRFVFGRKIVEHIGLMRYSMYPDVRPPLNEIIAGGSNRK